MLKLPISAVVASYNEGALLKQCLASLSFCGEILVIDLDSTDDTLSIARAMGARALSHPRVPTVEYVRQWAYPKVAFDWILFTDPDEVYTPEVGKALAEILPEIPENIGGIEIPIKYYFRGRPLKGGIWGGKKYRRALRHRLRNNFNSEVHEDIRLKTGYTLFRIESEHACIHHYWVTGISQLFEKHRRYLKEEGPKMYRQGMSFSRGTQWLAMLKGFRYSFYYRKGYLDGLTGLFLSLFWSWYIFGCWQSLRQVERKPQQ